MKNHDFIPYKDADLETWATNFITRLSQNAAAWDIPNTILAPLSALNTAWKQKYSLAEAPATRTPVAVEAKNEAGRALRQALRSTVNEYVRYNHFIPDTGRLELQLPLPKRGRTPSPDPTTHPRAQIKPVEPLQIVISFYDDESESRAKPAGVHGVEMKWGFGDDRPPADADELTNSVFDTHTPLTLTFRGADRGRRVYFFLRWENTRGVKGPWSMVYSAVVP
ncbi:MAG: hypothetical protein LBR49_06425 [Tannerella sp.]|jgi:hypothetical protein|nr:hypothetical protein [Tannerella sp.]